MRIVWNEMKKILTWKMTLFLLLVNMVFYFLLIEFYIENFPNGRPALDSYRIGIEMIEEYGTKMNEDDLQDFRGWYDVKVDEANEYLAARPEYATAGLGTYEELVNSERETEEQSALVAELFFAKPPVDIFYEAQVIRGLVDFHENKEFIGFDNGNEKQEKRFQELLAENTYQVFPSVAFENFRSFINGVAIAILFSVVLLISPFILQDRSGQMLDLQYTAKAGRKLYRAKLTAGMLAAGIVMTVLLAVYFSLYAQNGTAPYFPVNVNSFITVISWYDPTFLQYILLCVAGIYVIGFSFSMFAMAISSVAPNFVTLIGIQIPVIFLMLIAGLKPLLLDIVLVYYPQWLVPVVYGVMIIGFAGLLVYLMKREKSRDVLE